MTTDGAKFFYEDSVCRINKKGYLQFGLVTQNSEALSSSDSEDDEPPKIGEARVAWHPTGIEQVVKEKDVHLAERSLMPGDIVRRTKSKDGSQQHGICKQIDVLSSLKVIGTDKIICGVPTVETKPLTHFETNLLVYKDGWVGMISSVRQMITLVFKDGSKVKVDQTVAANLQDIHCHISEESYFGKEVFFPGQILFGPLRLVEMGEWLYQSANIKSLSLRNPRKAFNMLVQSCEVESITVGWIGNFANCGTTPAYRAVKPANAEEEPMPSEIVEGKEELERARVLNLFQPCSTMIGDKVLYKLKKTDVLLNKQEWRRIETDQIMRRTLVSNSSTESVPESKTKDTPSAGDAFNPEDCNVSSAAKISNEGDVDPEEATETLEVKKDGSLEGFREYLKNKLGMSTTEENCQSVSREQEQPVSNLCQNSLNEDSEDEIIDHLAEGTSASISKKTTEQISRNSKRATKRRPSESLRSPSEDVRPATDSNALTPGRISVRASHGTSGSSHQGKSRKKRRVKKARRDHSKGAPKITSDVVRPGGMIVGETLNTRSEVNVMWQDGTQERLYSTELYPIQHLDDHDFFPGDFVVRSTEDPNQPEYGVVQSVDFGGRCCKVGWFSNFNETTNTEPQLIDTEEYSVYDLKDHPDFRFRQGSVVTRLSNIKGEECGFGAGQVVDITREGKVMVWWVTLDSKPVNLNNLSDHPAITLCWPQELYKVGDYNSDEGELWDEEESETDGSWETESEEDVQYSDLESDEAILDKLEKIKRDLNEKSLTMFMENIQAYHQDCKSFDSRLQTSFFSIDELQNYLVLLTTKGQNLMDDSVRSSFQDLRNFIQQQISKMIEVLKSRLGNTSQAKETEPNMAQPSESSNIDDLKLDEIMAVEIFRQMEEMGFEKYAPISLCKDSTTDVELSTTPDESRSSERLKCCYNSKTKEAEEESSRDVSGLQKSRESSQIEAKSGQDQCRDGKSFLTCDAGCGGDLSQLDSVPLFHRFSVEPATLPVNPALFLKTIKREFKLCQNSLPHGISVRTFGDRMDLLSAMLEGPPNTPYQDGLFFFDIMLGPNYPNDPPAVNYVSYCTDRLNPNLYSDGKVCISLLGTWTGKGTEKWRPDSTLLQLLVSIQGLILVKEPYFNEAGYEKQRGSELASENSKMYNEMAIVKLVQSMSKLLTNPHSAFLDEVKNHFRNKADGFIKRLESWIAVSRQAHIEDGDGSLQMPNGDQLPDFPLLPASKGCCLSLERELREFKTCLKEVIMHDS